jgi:2-polyprenyl-3-methyl-5-hydroxy-6-metoxy-1,4-benzoquinol methylase
MADRAPSPADALPPCPITRRPARRKVQEIGERFLRNIWRFGLGVDARRFFQDGKSLGLYESDCGLMFFEPRHPGDAAFYAQFYRRADVHRYLNSFVESRTEYLEAARHVPAGALVLDVGCGPGEFRRHLAHATFRGLDPYAPADADASVIRETLEQHLAHNAGSYDVVTAFQLIEHVAEPREFAAEMVKLLKPGGLLILVAPLHPSPLSEIPNFLINAPPHHMTWWSKPAFAALAETLGLEPVRIAELPASTHQGPIHWLHRLSFRHTEPPPNDRYYLDRLSWHASQVVAFWLARVAWRFKALPKGAKPIDVMLVARKPR